MFDTDGKSFSIVEFDRTLMKKEDEDRVSQQRLTFNRFLQAIGHFALATFCDVYPSKPPENLVTCMLCEIGRSLQRSSVMKIISRRRNRVTTNPATLMRGVKNFQMEVLKLYRENDAGMKDQGDGSSENNSDKNSSNKSLIYLDEIEDGEEESGFNIHSARLSPRSLSPPRSNRTFLPSSQSHTPVRSKTPVRSTNSDEKEEEKASAMKSPVGTYSITRAVYLLAHLICSTHTQVQQNKTSCRFSFSLH